MTPLERKKLQLAKARREQRARLRLAFDAENPTAEPTPAQWEVIKDSDTRVHWIVASNRSGKSAVGGRIVAWWFQGDHPFCARPPEWKGSLQILVVGRITEQMDSELWVKKIKPFLAPGTYREVRTGGALQRVVNTENGNRIIFLSHHDAQNAREKVQAFTSHVVWLDEMPDHAGLVTELLTRVLTTNGRLYATFTPLIRNADIHKIVTTPAEYSRQHRFLMLDNPIFKGKEAEVEAQMRANCASLAEFRCRVYGEWWEGDTRATRYDPVRHKIPLPADYDPQAWRHLAVLDPAASGLAGLSVWGEHPTTGRWYAVKTTLHRGTAAFDLYDAVEAELAGLNITHRYCDCNPAGFYKESARRGGKWLAYTDKMDRKVETLDLLNTRLLEGRMVLTPACELLEEDLLKAEWSATPGKLVNASSLHLLDTARYAADVLPAHDPRRFVVRTQSQELRAEWKAKQTARASAESAARARLVQWRSRWTRRLSF